MYCSKCKFNSFDHLPKCPKCGFDWKSGRDALQLSWLQSPGYDWLKHAQQRNNEPNAAMISPIPDDASGFTFSDDEMPLVSASNGNTGPDIEAESEIDSPSPLLVEELSYVDLPDNEPRNGQPEEFLKAQELVEVFPEELEVPSSMPEATTATIPVETGNEIELSVGARGDASVEEEDSAPEDILAAWEIPDDIVPGTRNIGEDEDLPERSGLADFDSRIDQPEMVLEADIEYDFSAIEVEISPSAHAGPADPDSIQNPSAAADQGERS